MLHTKLQEIVNGFNSLPNRTASDRAHAQTYLLESLNAWLRSEPDYMWKIILAEFTVELRNWETNPSLLAAVEMMEGAIALREMNKEIRLAATDLRYEDV